MIAARPPADRGPRRGGAAGARRRRRLRAAADRRLRRAARGGARRRPGRRAQLDAAVARVLRMKFRLGLFDRPYVDVPTDGRPRRARRRRGAGSPATSPSARWSWSRTTGPAARRRPSAVAVIGPIADSARDLLGDYSHLSTWRPCARCATGRTRSASSATATSSSRATSWPAADDPRRAPRVAGRRRGRATPAAPGSPGRDRRGARRGRRGRARRRRRDRRARRAVRADRRLDDRRVPRPPDLGFLGRQQELLEAVVATGTPVVLVVVSGRPLAIEWAAGHCAAILLAWVPGDAGPDAIADVLDRRRRTRAASCRSRSRATSARCRSRTGTTRPAATRSPRATTSTGRSRRSGRSGSGCPTRRSRSTGLRVDRSCSRPAATR